MPPRSLSPRLRWALPPLAAAVVAGGVALGPVLTADATDPLPERSASELLVAVGQAQVPGLSGTVVSTARLGLPALPTVGTSPTSPLALASGSRTLRVWYAGRDHARLAVMGQIAESDLVRNGRDVWTYDSTSNAVNHYRLPERPADSTPSAPPALEMVDPAAAAAAVVAAVEPTTTVSVSVGRTVRVAGRAAYELVLEPRDPASLIGSIRLAVDGETSVPLRVRVYSRTDPQSPAYEVGFTSVRFGVPDPEVFAFAPPSGASVKENQLPFGLGFLEVVGRSNPPTPVWTDAPTVVGSGWTAVVGFLTSPPTDDGSRGTTLDTLRAATRPVEGGRLLTTALVSVLFADDGRIYAGAVTPERLLAAARSAPRP